MNAEWGTDFEHWEEVRPELTDTALWRTDGNYASWNDHVAFAQAVRASTDALHGVDPLALSALEGGQIPGSDYGLLAESVGVMESMMLETR